MVTDGDRSPLPEVGSWIFLARVPASSPVECNASDPTLPCPSFSYHFTFASHELYRVSSMKKASPLL